MTESESATTDTEAARRAVEAVWHIESGRLVAGLARITRDVGLAEEMAQDALVAALEQWPVNGIPPHPAGWLMTTAKRRAIDTHRRDETFARKAALLAVDDRVAQGGGKAVDSDEALDALDDHIGDDLLRLVFTSCHPALSLESRVALTLKCLAGLSTEEIGRAFLVPETTAAQRIVRAKRTLTERGISFELPSPEQLSERLSSVLQVVYLIFNEGYAVTAGDDWVRPELCSEAMRLGRLLATLVPDEPEVHGLLALMELQASRLPARVGPEGEAVLLPDQDRRRWDRLLVRRGLESLTRAEALPGSIGPYTLQAGIAACHARAARAEATDWARIAALYEVLASVWPSPVVELNRAVAVGFSTGPEAGLAVADAAAASGQLARYPHLHSVRGDLLARAGRGEEAAEAFALAAELSRNESERSVFLTRAAYLRGASGP